MTKCDECSALDLGVIRVIKNDEEFVLCPNCGAEDSVRQIDELEFLDDVALHHASLGDES
jgi:Zn finger protein HypA/HybF involved in hydrogenase expression